MNETPRTSGSPSVNPLTKPSFQPVLDVIRKVVFRRDREASCISLDDLREALRFLTILRSDARRFLTRELGELHKSASEEELKALLTVDHTKQKRLRFEQRPGEIFRNALLRFDDGFVQVMPMSKRGQMNYDFANLRAAARVVPGQDEAAREAASYLAVALAEDDRERPATLFLHGSLGSGCRDLTQALGHAMERMGYDLLELDLSQFRNEGEEASICGSKPYWSGSREGIVTAFIHRHPKSVVLFHNADRTLPRVLEALTQPLLAGVWVDQYGLDETEEEPSRNRKRAPTTVDCRRCVFLFNSSESCEWLHHGDFSSLADDRQTAKAMVLEAMRDATQVYRGEKLPVFHSALLDLIGEHLVVLKAAEWKSLRTAAKRGLQQAARTLRNRYACRLLLKSPQALADLQLLRYGPAQGISACDPRSIERGLLEDFGVWCVEQTDSAPVTLDIDEQAREKLAMLLQDLGRDPVAELRRKGQLLHYFMIPERDEANGVTFMIRHIDIRQTPRLKDFTGEVHLEASVPKTGFRDVAGHSEAKRFFQEVIGYLRQPERVTALGVDLPKGVVLYGPPGTGKTRLAQAFAGEAGLPFISVSGTDLLYPNRIAELYRIALKAAPCAIFIDEVDVIGKRGKQGAAHDAAINSLLTRIQGFSSSQPVFHILATNRPEVLDEALLRPGRIDRRFHCGALDREGRAGMIERLLKICQLEPSWQDKLISLTYGMTGADLEQVAREAALRRLRLPEDRPLHIDEAIEEINTLKFGAKREFSHPDTPLRRRVALHEVGHAMVLRLKMPDLPLEVITITPRNNSAGFVSLNLEQLGLCDETPSAVRGYLAGILAGRGAEMIAYGDEGRSAGAVSDLSRATRVAWNAVAHAGLDGEMPIGSLLGFSEYGEAAPEPLRRMAWERTQHWLKEAENEAISVLRQHWTLVQHLAERLLEKEHIDGDEFAQIVEQFEQTALP